VVSTPNAETEARVLAQPDRPTARMWLVSRGEALMGSLGRWRSRQGVDASSSLTLFGTQVVLLCGQRVNGLTSRALERRSPALSALPAWVMPIPL
jgi:hypothetical protein